MLTLREIASRLGGEVNGSFVLAPGPGHGKRDRSLKVSLTNGEKDGFVTHSFAGDDWKECREYVYGRLGIRKEAAPKTRVIIERLSPEQERYTKARELWANSRTDDLRQHLRLVYPKLFKDEIAWNEAFRVAGASA